MSWVDGRRDGAIDSRDRGLHYGDGAFETMRVRGGAIRLLDYHLERLDDACRRLAIRPPLTSRLRRELMRIAAPRSDAVIKLIITRGIGARGYRPSGRERATRIISIGPMSQPYGIARPVRARVCATRLGTNPTLAGLKTLNRLESILARAEWSDPRIWEGLMRDADDHFVCGTMSNLFVRSGSQLMTPKLDRCGIAGVMRRFVMERAAGLRLQVREKRLRWKDLAAAEEIFLTNAVVGVAPLAVVEHGRLRIRCANHSLANELNRQLDCL